MASSLLAHCDYQVLGDQTDSGFWHQDLFSGGPMRLGSAVSKVNEQKGILTRLMGANGPHYCEDALLDRENEAFRMARALISRWVRIRANSSHVYQADRVFCSIRSDIRTY